MESILIGLFGGGILDWEDISQTQYDWEYILIRTQDRGIEEIEINDFYYTILELAKEDFCDMIDDFITEYKDNEDYKEEIEILKDFNFNSDNNWDLFCNCLDTHIHLFTTEEVIETLEKVNLLEQIENINDKIGFTYIQIESN